jgi:hypothetical protein
MNVKALLNSAVKIGRKAAPIVLLASGTVLAVDAIVKTPGAYEEATEIITLEERKIKDDGGAPLRFIDKAKLGWKSWLPVIWREGTSLACFYAAFHLKHKRGAAIAAAYTLLEKERDDLDQALREALGNNNYEAKKHEMMNKDIEKALKVYGDQLAVGNDEALAIYYEPVSGKIFKADPRKIKAAVETLDERYGTDGFASLSEFFRLLHIDPPQIGDYVGWEYAPGDPHHITYKTYDYHWEDKDIYITGLDMGLKLDNFVRTWW